MSGAYWSDDEMKALRALFPRSLWPELLAALPARSRSAITQQANLNAIKRQINKRLKWSATEEGVLRSIYQSADRGSILAALPLRNWVTIVKHANDLKIVRPSEAERCNTRFIHPIIQQLKAERLQRRMDRPTLSRKIGYHVNQLHMWELGKTQPEFQAVFLWADGLGFELVLRPSAESKS